MICDLQRVYRSWKRVHGVGAHLYFVFVLLVLKIDPLIATEAQHLRPSSRSDPMLVTRSLKLYNMVGSAEVSNRGDNETCMIKSSFKDILHIVPNTKKTDSKQTGCGKRKNV